ncbi:MAG: HD family phosphohydrolase [Phycisphaerales bacterium]
MANPAKPRANGKPAGPRNRREGVRKAIPRPTQAIIRVARDPHITMASLILALVAILVSLMVIWTRETRLPAVGDIMRVDHAWQIDVEEVDPVATERLRDEARLNAENAWVPNREFGARLRDPLINLATRVAESDAPANSIGSVEVFPGRTPLTKRQLDAVAATNSTAELIASWTETVDRVIAGLLSEHPVLVRSDFARWQSAPGETIVILGDSALDTAAVVRGIPIVTNLEDAAEQERQRNRLRLAISDEVPGDDLDPVVADAIWEILTSTDPPVSSLSFDQEITNEFSEIAASTVEDALFARQAGLAIHKRGDVLTIDQLQELVAERRALRASSDQRTDQFTQRLGAAGICLMLVTFIGFFLHSQYPRIIERRTRLLALGGMMVAGCAITSLGAVEVAAIALPAAIGPVLVIALVVRLAYDHRLAYFLAAVQSAIATLALDGGVGLALVLWLGAATLVLAVGRLRNRNSLVRAGLITAGVLGVAAMVHELLVTPNVPGVLSAVLSAGGWAASTGVTVAFMMLGLLPSIERMGDIITGMTLAELRDPSQDLLRELSLRAPGTYNHSLSVATIAEAAAEKIGADSLLVYVGALYHDIGKMNKPHYFVENQSDGVNRHDKLTPSMSVLLIFGHVKDGIELAREYNLPRPIQHFIESHHGTSLVEYFYHSAKAEADQDENVSVDEFEFRYPGPRPRTKEAAILMLCDAVESATRAMSEPNPARIEQVVRELTRKRLLDHQLDESTLTFRELALIEDAMIARLTAVHHGRVKYPKAAARDDESDGDATSTEGGDGSDARSESRNNNRSGGDGNDDGGSGGGDGNGDAAPSSGDGSRRNGRKRRVTDTRLSGDGQDSAAAARSIKPA